MEISAILALVGFLEPYIVKAIQSGEISKEQQAQLQGRLDSLRTAAAFQGEEWKPSTAGGPVVSAPVAVAGTEADGGAPA